MLVVRAADIFGDNWNVSSQAGNGDHSHPKILKKNNSFRRRWLELQYFLEFVKRNFDMFYIWKGSTLSGSRMKSILYPSGFQWFTIIPLMTHKKNSNLLKYFCTKIYTRCRFPSCVVCWIISGHRRFGRVDGEPVADVQLAGRHCVGKRHQMHLKFWKQILEFCFTIHKLLFWTKLFSKIC